MKRNGIFILLLLTISFYAGTLLVNSQVDIQNESEMDEDLFLLVKREGNEEDIQTITVLDENNSLHYFSQIYYDNGTFLIIHAVNEETNLVVLDDFPMEPFEAYVIPGGVILFYSFRTFYGVNKYFMYKWIDGEIENINYYTINEFFAIPPKVYLYYNKTDVSFDMILTSMTSEGADPLSEIVKTKIRLFKVYLNGTTRAGEHWIIDFEFDFLIDFDYFNGTLYAQYRYMYQYNPNHIYVTMETALFNTTITNFMIVDEGGFDPAFFVSDDGLLHTTLIREGKLYTLEYAVNETISLDMFNITEIGMSSYADYYLFKHSGHQTYIFNSEPYIEYQEFFENKNLKSKISILNYNNTDASLNEFYIYNVPELDNYHSFYVLDYGNGSAIYTHSSLLSQEDIVGSKLSHTEYIGFYIVSNISLSLPSEPHLFNLGSISGFALFWNNVGLYLVIALGAVGIIYVVFRKFFNNIVKSMIAFFSRPLKPDARKITNFFSNLWLFIFNGITTLYILFKTNKRRHLMNLIGMTVLAVIVISSTSLFNSKQRVLISEYTDQINVTDDNIPSLSITLNFDTSGMGSSNPIIEDFNEQALSEILTSFRLNYKTLSSIISDFEISTFMYMTAMDPNDNLTLSTITYYGMSRNYTVIMEAILSEGSLPLNRSEVIISRGLSGYLGLGINDTVKLYGATRSAYNFELGSTYANVTIVGIYDGLPTKELYDLLETNNLPLDAVKSLASVMLGGGVMTFIDHTLPNLQGLYPYYMVLTSYIQFRYNFDNFDPSMMSALKVEQDEIIEGNVHVFEFQNQAAWALSGELDSIIDVLEPKLNSSIFLFFTLAVPILYLSFFLIFETNDLYSKSMEQEIEIFQAKGLSTFRIAWNYSLLKLVEAIFATVIGFAISLALIPALLKMDSFISFNNPFVSINLSSLPLATVFTVFILIVISLPKIIQLSRSKRTQQKTPQRVIQLFKRIRLPPLLLIVLGVGILFGGLQLYRILYGSVGEGSSSILMSFIYIAGTGVLFAMLGIGLLLKDLHAIIVIILSKIAWNLKKSIRTFSLVEVRSDVQLFNNIFLTFFILVGITLPSIICPLSVQYNFTKDAYFRTGSDMYINNWNDQNSSLLPVIEAIPGIQAVTNVSAVDAHYRGHSINLVTIQNLTAFIEVTIPPPTRMFNDWQEELNKLYENTSMIATQYFKEKVADDYNAFTFSNYHETVVVTMLIRGIFDYFPMFYEVGPFVFGESKRINALVMTEQNYQWIQPAIIEFGRFKDRLLIKLNEGADYEPVKEALVQMDFDVESAEEEATTTQFRSYPFYSIIAAEFAISILICLVAIVFVSISNPIKILQQRTDKNDRLKKMGISTKRIIRLTAIETFTTGVLPGILFGTGFGFAIITLFISTTKRYFYSGIDFLLVYSPIAMVISYVIAPVLFLGIFYISMRRNYAKYLPRNLE
ncbi:MAG: ABC transporter permease [Candidatus Heimdallarchaeota archaeon]|nr:ABC transporter permease [Candidatus Heimdallarchaeota archaeon]MCK4953936.1 ABC transporter permease [Candidatus Heimdallarchaeota archaeon]